MTTIGRFVEKVTVTGGAPGDCWLWSAARNRRGYGVLCVDRAMRLAHRVSWELFRSVGPGALEVCHRCDVPSCVRPSHLFLGTHAQNMADMARKGRWAVNGRNGLRGERNPSRKLDERSVLEILSSTESRSVLAARFGVSISLVSKVRAGEVWSHVKGGSK